MPDISNIRDKIQKRKNFYFPSSTFDQGFTVDAKGGQVKKNLSYSTTRVQFQRIRQDIKSWRQAVNQAEQMFFPFRASMQRIFMDTILNLHVAACMSKRRNLTLLRDFKICDEAGNEDEDLKKIFRDNAQQDSSLWFDNFVTYVIDAVFYGYSLVTLGDLENDAFPELDIVRRENISPDRKNVSSLPQMVAGEPFLTGGAADWHIWVPTPGETGREACGYGLLYKIAPAEIYLRNNTGNNADYNEMYGQPIRKGKTSKTDPDERNAFEKSLSDVGSNAYIMLDEGEDDVEFLESKNSGTGHLTYSDLEARMEKKISKLVLGHADALDSTPGKLGAGQKNGGESPQEKALAEIQMNDGRFTQAIINGQLIPRMQKFGFNIPPNYHFEWLNNQEIEEMRKKEDESNNQTAAVVVSLFNAGYQVDAAYITERTGIPVTLIPTLAPVADGGKDDPNPAPL